MTKRARQYIGIATAVVTYYIIHEGAHLLYALGIGAFKWINFLQFGIQIDVYAERMTDAQLRLFCLAGAVSTLIAGWLLAAGAKTICKFRSKLLRAALYYITIALLLLDPLYLSLLCGFFGGGDMNGIRLLCPEIAARSLFGAVLIINALTFWKSVLPTYTRSFQRSDEPK